MAGSRAPALLVLRRERNNKAEDKCDGDSYTGRAIRSDEKSAPGTSPSVLLKNLGYLASAGGSLLSGGLR